MTDPYKVLGISSDATDEEVKSAYRSLVKKYHPDKYAGSPLADMANEKMAEVNEAYDQIMKMRKEGTNAQGGGNNSYGYNPNQNYNQTTTNFPDVRTLINQGRFADAEQILDGVAAEKRTAEWYFLKGVCQSRRGFTADAYNNINRAVQMDPNNFEYRQAFNQFQGFRGGAYGGYNNNPNAQVASGCNTCSNICCAVACANLCSDCCCNGCR